MALIEWEEEGGTVTLALNRPDRRNALSPDIVVELNEALDAIAADDDVRAVLLTGRGRAFCAGGDLGGGVASAELGVLGAHQQRGAFADLLRRIPAMRVPVIAAVNGDALGGGLGLATACDVTIADPAACFGTPELNVGLFPHVILPVLQRHVPRKVLLEMVLTGATIDASRALSVGLVTRISAPGAALSEAREVADALCSRSAAVVALGKQAFHRVSDMGYDDALEFMNAQLTLNLLTDDAMEGVAAFLQKRPANWKGR